MLKAYLSWLFASETPADPIDHPALRDMTPDELSDLPLWARDLDDDQRSSTTISAVTELAM